MIKFVKRTIGLICVLVSVYLILGFLADGYTDPFYLRFTSSQKQSLILGTSRAAQGILPDVLDENILSQKYEGSIYNYSFTVLHSPFGETYYNAIVSKLDKNTKKGLFIVTVDPWAIASRKDIDYLRETKLELSQIQQFNCFPNFDYLTNAYKKSYFYLIKSKFEPDRTMFLHDNGWLEVNIDTSQSKIVKGSAEKINNYRNRELPNHLISNNRVHYLIKIIKLLKKHGRVIIVRIPVDNRMLAIENKLDPFFNKRMLAIANTYSSPFLSYEDDSYIFPDGNHLYKESSKKFSKKLAKDINHLFINE